MLEVISELFKTKLEVYLELGLCLHVHHFEGGFLYEVGEG